MRRNILLLFGFGCSQQGWMWLACRSRDSATTPHKLFHYVKGNKNYSIFRWVYFMSSRHRTDHLETHIHTHAMFNGRDRGVFGDRRICPANKTELNIRLKRNSTRIKDEEEINKKTTKRGLLYRSLDGCSFNMDK